MDSGTVTRAVGGILGTLTTMLLVMIMGIYVAMEPRLYERGVAWMLPDHRRSDFHILTSRMAYAMRRLMFGRLVGMVFEGVVTYIMLAVYGVPMAALLSILTGLLAFSVAIIIIPVTLQMISRYTALIPAYIWTEEMARFLFIWMIMIGAMIGVREGTHFDVDVWPELKPKINAALRIVSMLFVLLFALIFVWYGYRFLQFGWNQTSELADLPMWLIFIAWPVAGVSWLLFLIEAFMRDIGLYKRGEDLDAN